MTQKHASHPVAGLHVRRTGGNVRPLACLSTLLAFSIAAASCGEADTPSDPWTSVGNISDAAPDRLQPGDVIVVPEAGADAVSEDVYQVDAGPDAGAVVAPVLELGDVAAWMASHVPAPTGFSKSDPLLVVVAAGTNNRIASSDLHPAETSTDPVQSGPDTGGLPWWGPGDSGFQAGNIAIGALQAAGWGPCDINSGSVQFVLWGYGDDTKGIDFYYRGPQDVGVDLFRVHSVGGSNMAIDGPLNNGLPAHTAVAVDEDARSLADAIESFAAGMTVSPRVLVVAHSWGAAYAGYYIDQLYSRADSPPYQLLAGVLAASPSKVLTHPLAFGTDACPPDLNAGSSPLSLTCDLRTCLTLAPSPTHRAFCTMEGKSGALRSTPVYSFERPDDPIPPADPSTLVQAYQSATGVYPGINGHDYIIRTNDSYDLLDGYAFDASNGGVCAASDLSPRQFVTGGGPMRFLGIHGIHTERSSCLIGYDSRLVYLGRCDDASRRDTGNVGVSQDAMCGTVRPGQQSDVCILDRKIAKDGSPAPFSSEACFVTGTSGGTALLSNPAQANARASAGFVACAH